jgi:hypothetical protein
MQECLACGERWLDWEVARRLDVMLDAMLARDVEVATRQLPRRSTEHSDPTRARGAPLTRAMLKPMESARTFQFTITVVVEPGQDGYDDPEWIADAAWGALSNEYGYDCTYGALVELPGSDSSTSSSEVTEP